MSFSPSHFVSPLRYPGGKTAIANFIKLILRQNNLVNGQYVEVYAGGAGVAWSLLFEEYIQHVFINDISKPLFAFWHSVLDDTDSLCKLVYDTPITIQERDRRKAIQLGPDNYSILELGFSTFFLNRTNRSGILKGGVIGGKAQSGKWKLDARFNKSDLISRIQRIARYANRITLYNLDASCFIENILPTLSTKALIYLDPPYYHKGHELYENYYSNSDHVKLACLISKQIKQSWIVSYDSAPEIATLYRQYRKIKYSLNYSAQIRYAGSETMFFSKNLILPVTKSKENYSNSGVDIFVNPVRIKLVDPTPSYRPL